MPQNTDDDDRDHDNGGGGGDEMVVVDGGGSVDGDDDDAWLMLIILNIPFTDIWWWNVSFNEELSTVRNNRPTQLWGESYLKESKGQGVRKQTRGAVTCRSGLARTLGTCYELENKYSAHIVLVWSIPHPQEGWAVL